MTLLSADNNRIAEEEVRWAEGGDEEDAETCMSYLSLDDGADLERTLTNNSYIHGMANTFPVAFNTRNVSI